MIYTPLYIKTHNSLLSSIIDIDNLILYAIKNNIKSLTITDNNMYGVMEFYQKCINNNIKPIVGLEIKIDNNFVVLYTTNYNGYKNLMKINTLINNNDLTLLNLAQYSTDLICIVPYNSLNIYQELSKLFMNIFKGYRNEMERNDLEGDNLLYFNEVLYIEKSEKNYLKYLYAIRDGISFIDVKIDKNNNHLLLRDDLVALFPKDIENNYKIFEMCNLEMKYYKNLLPIYECPNGIDSYSYLKQLCKEGLKKIFGEKVYKVYIERLKYELEIINRMNLCNYFLVVWDYIKFAKDNAILVGPGRGSAAGSLVSYCLNITDIDPIKYNLLFERFLNPERITLPDIDVDFEDDRREEVINYCIKKYGGKKVAGVITFGTLGAKQVVRDVARTMEIEINIVDQVCKMLNSNISLSQNYHTSLKLREYISKNQKLVNMYKVASKFEGLKRHTSVHPAGIVMSAVEVDEVVPLDKKNDNFYTTAYSMEYLEAFGLLKMDFLGLRNLSLITNVIKEIEKHENKKIIFSEITLNDSKTIKLFNDVLTVGIFQFESSGMVNFLRKFKPNNFEDIVVALALFRPGPMQNIDSYIKRRNNQEKIDYFHPDLEKILKPTYGIIVYQEQIMQIANVMAGYSLGEADVLRRAMSKKKEDIMLAEKNKFVNRAIAKNYDKDTAIKVFNLILKFAAYGFNRSHAVSYAVIAYKMAYLKVYYPLYFMKSLLTMVIESEVKTKEYIYECKKNNIKIIAPDINNSSDEYLIKDNAIMYPLSAIKNVGNNSIEVIVNARKNGSFKNIYDFIRKVYGKGVNKKIIESLIDAGCFKEFNLNKKTLQENLDIIINYGDLIKDIDSKYALEPQLTFYEEYDIKELLKRELNVFGFYLSNHPVTNLRNTMKTISLDLLPNYFDKNIEVILLIDYIKEINTKNNQKMAFLKGSDEINVVECVLFSNVYNDINAKIGDIVKIEGRVEKRYDKLQIVVSKLVKI